MKKVILIFSLFITAVLIFTTRATACSVCFGATQDKTLVNALQYGVFSLLLVLGGVVALFVHFFLSFQKRAKNMS